MYAIGLCLDENYLLPGLVTIMSIAQATSALDRKSIAVRVITNDLSKPHGDAIAAFSKALGFGSFDIEWRGLNDGYRIVNGPHITATTYLRFDFSPAFVQRPYLIYLDCDLLVLGDLTSPFDAISAAQVGAVRDEFNFTLGECPALPGFVERFPAYHGRPYFNAGALWLRTNLVPVIKDGISAILSGHKRRYIHFNDQDAINMWMTERGAVVQQLAGHLNRFEIDRFVEIGDPFWQSMAALGRLNGGREASVLHFIGELKPWLRRCPSTPGVRSYRVQMDEARRLLCKLRLQTICVQDDR
jgi:lipopolysaccharide biosynthesis glycosyltransferase